MANLNPLISFTEPVTRQDLFDMWSAASFSGVTVDDFAEGFMPVVLASSFSDAPSSPQPGQPMWHMSENLMFVWHDELEGTGVSLWLAIGPDRFDTAMLTKTAVACGEAVELVGPGRTVQAIEMNEAGRNELPQLCGFNQSGINAPNELVGGQEPVEALVNESGETYWMGETAATDSWIAVGTDGIMYMGSPSGSHPTQAMADWANGNSLILHAVEGLPAGVVSSNDITDPFAHIVGTVAIWNIKADSTARTEPWWLTKSVFLPRASKGNYYTQ